MSDIVNVHYFGGPWDGRVEPVQRSDFDMWVGHFPYGGFLIGSSCHLYQSFAMFTAGDEIVEVHHTGIVDGSDELDGYDGWLSPSDRYDDSEGQP